MPKRLLYTFFFLISPFFSLQSQIYYEADPFNFLHYEKHIFQTGTSPAPLLFRPSFQSMPKNYNNRWSLTARAEYFENSSAPNLENSSVRWVGKGISRFNSMRLSYSGNNLIFSIEPYHFYTQNLDYNEPVRKALYSKLNDQRARSESPFNIDGIREFQFFLHIKGLGLGVSNANMWWGPGIHSSLQMTSNTVGLNYFSVGTIREKRISKLGIDLRYLFAPMDYGNSTESYFSALLLQISTYTEPVFSFGFSRSYLSGPGIWGVDWAYISMKDALLLPFEALFLESKQTDPDRPESSVDWWDEVLVGYLEASFPHSGLKVFVEFGRDDHAWDWDDFSRQPDHSGAGVVGLRKYGLFGRENLVGGLEYTNLIKSKFWTKRVPGAWYSKEIYNYSSYQGRHWGAHSGPDSDDFYIFLGYMSEKFSIIPAFNYERHGVIDNAALVLEKRSYLVYNPDTGRWEAQIVEQWREKQVNIWPEVKIELRLDIRYRFKGFDLNLYYEDEFVDNLEFNWGERRGKVWWIGIERTIDSEDFRAFRKRKLP